MTAASSWLDQLKRWSVPDVAARLGLEVVARGNDASFPCPVCHKQRRHSKGTDSRLAAKVIRGARWWCEPCGASGDAVALACAVVTGKAYDLDAGRWAEVKALCEGAGLTDAFPRVSAAPLAQPPSHPPRHEVEKFWKATRELRGPAADYLTSRGFRLDWTSGLVRLSPTISTATWWPTGRLERWPLVFPAYDATGVLASIHARAISGDVEPKTLWPKGFSSSGLLFADDFGVSFLRCCACGVPVAHQLEAVFIAEGATDTLKMATILQRSQHTRAALGFVAGSRSALANINWPASVPCIIATDDDAAGDAYAEQVKNALGGKTRVFRVRPPQGRDAAGRKAGDWSDLADDAALEALADAKRWEVLA